MSEITLPLICPNCESVQEVIEVADQVVTNDFYKWDAEKKRYVWNYNDSDNYGDLYLECAECQDHRYTQAEYDAFMLNNPITQGEIKK